MTTKPYDQAFKYLAEQDAEALLFLLGDLQPGQPAEIELFMLRKFPLGRASGAREGSQR
jgi:hypothetical protein